MAIQRCFETHIIWPYRNYGTHIHISLKVLESENLTYGLLGCRFPGVPLTAGGVGGR